MKHKTLSRFHALGMAAGVIFLPVQSSTAAEWVSNGGFTGGTSTAWIKAGAANGIGFSPESTYTCQGEAWCRTGTTLNVANACIGGATTGAESLTQVLTNDLSPNKRYRLSFRAWGIGASTLSAAVINPNGGHYIARNVQPTPGFPADYKVDFTTPVNGNMKAAVKFAANAASGAAACISSVSLQDLSTTNITPNSTAPLVRVNTYGYKSRAAKQAILVNVPAGSPWQLMAWVPSTQSWFATAVTGTTTTPKLDADSGDMTSIADFSALASTDPAYAITVYNPNGSVLVSSPTFYVRSDFSSLANDSLDYFYQNRSNVAINSALSPNYPGLGKPLSRNAGHVNDAASCYKSETITTLTGGPIPLPVVTTVPDAHGNVWSGCTFPAGAPGVTNGKLDVSGGWYDAADHGKYVVNAGISVWTLLNQYERMVRKVGAAAAPTKALNEARVELEWMLKMQAPAMTMALPVGNQDVKRTQAEIASGLSGTWDTHSTDNTTPTVVGSSYKSLNIRLKMTPVDVDGMAFHAVHDRKWTGLPTDPSSYNVTTELYAGNSTPNPRVLMYPTTAATLNLAAVTAQCARVWRTLDPAFSAKCLAASTRALAAATRNPSIFRYEYSNAFDVGIESGAMQAEFEGGGAYGDLRIKDELYWANMELYLTTGTSSYKTAALSVANTTNDPGSALWSGFREAPYAIRGYAWENEFNWQSTAPLGTISALTVDPSGEFTTGTSAAAKTKLLSAADDLLLHINKQGYHFPKDVAAPTVDKNNQYRWGSNADILNRGLILAVAYDLSKAQKYYDGAAAAMDYILGRNALGRAYVTGYGSNAVENPHHRFWANHASALYPHPANGALVGGANQQIMAVWMTASRQADPAVYQNVITSYTSTPNYNWQGINRERMSNLWDRLRGYKHVAGTDCILTKNDGFQRGNCGDYIWDFANNRFSVKLAPTVTPVYTSVLVTPAGEHISDPGALNYLGATITQCQDPTTKVINAQKCHTDDYRSFATNEVAINWNASLYWMSAFLADDQ